MSLRDEQARSAQDSKAWFGDSGWGSERHILFLCTALAEELGEIAGPIKKMVRDGTPLPADHHLELADLFVYLSILAGALGYDLQNSVDQKREFNRQRFS